MDPNAGFSENADGVSGPEMTQMGRLEGTLDSMAKDRLGGGNQAGHVRERDSNDGKC